MLIKNLTLVFSIVLGSLQLHSQAYQIELDSDRDGIMNADDQDSLDRNVPFDSIFTYTYCTGEKAKMNLEVLFPGLEMRWDSCTEFDSHTGYRTGFVPKNQKKYYSTLYDTTTQTVIRRIVHIPAIGNEHLKLNIEKIEKKSFGRKKGINVVMQKGFQYYDWTFNNKWHNQTVMNIGRFYEDGMVRVIGDDKFGCPDTLEFEINIQDHYAEDKKEQTKTPEFGSFKPSFKKFTNLASASGKIDLTQLSGNYDGPYIFYLSDIKDGAEMTFRDDFMYLSFDKNSQQGTWKEDGRDRNFEIRTENGKYKINIDLNGRAGVGQIIRLDYSIMRILYGEGENQRIEEFYRVK